MHTPIMIIKSESTTFEVYILNEGEVFKGFGGSKRGLLVQRGASLIIRRYDHESGSMEDGEHDVNDPGIWKSLVNIMNQDHFTVETFNDNQ
jgi:hypothetical protein